MQYNNQVQLENTCSLGSSKKALMINHMRSYLARRNSTIIWGNGFVFNSNNEELEKFFKTYANKYRLNELFLYVEEQLSKFGRVLITLNKTDSGEIKPNLCDNMYLNVVAKSFYNEDLAVVWQRIYHDQSNYYVKSVYDTKKCINEVYDNNKKICAFDTQIEILKENRIPKVWNHNLGFVPVVEFYNYPALNSWAFSQDYNQVTDWFNCQLFENLYYQAYLDFKKELALCHSRIGLESVPQQVYQNIEDTLIRTSDLDYEERAYTLSDIVIETGVGGKATVISGNGDFVKYATAMDSIMDMYCKFANSARFSEGFGVQKSTQEIKTTRSAQVECINAKILLREQKCNEFFAKLFSALGMIDYNQEWDFNFKINGNIQKEETLILDSILKQMNVGLISVVEAISKLRNVSMSEAKRIFEEIQQFNEENEIITTNTMDNYELEESGPYDSVGGDGRPTDESEIQ